MFRKRHRSRFPKLSRLSIVVYLLFYAVCITQLYKYAAAYLQYRTVVQVNYVSVDRFEIPSITLCVPRLLSEPLEESSSENSKESKNKLTDDELADSLYVWFRNLSFVQKEPLAVSLKNLKIFEFNGTIRIDKAFVVEDKERNNSKTQYIVFYTNSSKPSPSKRISLAYNLKPCVTYDFDRYGNQSLREMAKIAYISLKGNREQLVKDEKNLLMAVHSRNVVLQNADLFGFNLAELLLSYNRNLIKSLPPPYQTECVEYGSQTGSLRPKEASGTKNESSPKKSGTQKSGPGKSGPGKSGPNFLGPELGPKKSGPGSQSQCILQCMFSNRSYHFVDLFFYDGLLVDSRLVRLADLSRDFAWSNALRIAEQACRQRCPIECARVAFDNIRLLDYGLQRPDPTLKAYFEHNMSDDLLTEHVPEVSFLEFAGGVGGLAGMWLGFSFLGIWERARRAWATYWNRVKTNVAMVL